VDCVGALVGRGCWCHGWCLRSRQSESATWLAEALANWSRDLVGAKELAVLVVGRGVGALVVGAGVGAIVGSRQLAPRLAKE
jgi:hypothetical protein